MGLEKQLRKLGAPLTQAAGVVSFAYACHWQMNVVKVPLELAPNRDKMAKPLDAYDSHPASVGRDVPNPSCLSAKKSWGDDHSRSDPCLFGLGQRHCLLWGLLG